MSDLKCSIADCLGEHEARGYCSKHYQRLRAHGDPLAVLTLRRPTIRQALADGYAENSATGCWEWQGAKGRHGYGVVTHRGRSTAAHRAAYEAWVGPLSPSLQINHKCDNPPCINPSHLYQGSQRDNVADMLARGRVNRKGESCNGTRKLDEATVHEIRRSPLSTRKAAEIFGVSQHTISDVRTYKSWSHICQI